VAGCGRSFFAWYADAARTALESWPPPAWLAALLFTVWHSLELAPAAHRGTGLWTSLRMPFSIDRVRHRFAKRLAQLSPEQVTFCAEPPDDEKSRTKPMAVVVTKTDLFSVQTEILSTVPSVALSKGDEATVADLML
jgi:hypothetical protein